MKTRTIEILVLLAGLLIAVSAFAGKPAADPIDVEWVAPSSGNQGQTLTVKVIGLGFEQGASVHFLVQDSRDESQIVAGPATFTASDPELNGTEWEGYDSLVSEIVVQQTAPATDYDVEVRAGKGRKGKGTTLFKVQSSQVNDQCSFEFEAEFRDDAEDGIRTDYPEDSPKTYVAAGGDGFRLDTNGSMKLERKNDSRWITVDFSAHDFCDDENPLLYNWGTNVGAEAAGFCSKLKGVDLRIEHQVQEWDGLCSLGWEAGNPGEKITVVISFLGDPDGLNGNTSGLLIDPDQNGTGPQPLTLNYGCQGLFIHDDYFDPSIQALITRVSENKWTIEGWQACLVTQLSYPLQQEGANPIILDMPFKLTIEAQGSP